MAQLIVRVATLDDARALGAVVMDALQDAPSALVDRDELERDQRVVGRDLLLHGSMHGFGIALAERGSQVVGAARVVPREFAFSSHVAGIGLLVAPAARRTGVARALLAWTLQAASEHAATERLEMAVAEQDVGLAGLLTQHGFEVERRERGALMTPIGARDLLIYARDTT